MTKAERQTLLPHHDASGPRGDAAHGASAAQCELGLELDSELTLPQRSRRRAYTAATRSVVPLIASAAILGVVSRSLTADNSFASSSLGSGQVPEVIELDGGTCRDTPQWTDGRFCAYGDGGRDSRLCKVQTGRAWPFTVGWTCEAYKESCQGGRLLGEDFADRRHPEQNCCVCGGGLREQAVPEQQCNNDTGGSCYFAFPCDKSRRASCVDGKCLCPDGLCAPDGGGRCEKPRRRKPTRMASSSVRATFGLEVAGAGQLCQSTPGWTDGQVACAMDQAGGQNKTLCVTAQGWTCEAYRRKGWCGNGTAAAGRTGLLKHHPELHCCACGGGNIIASVESAALAPAAECRRDTGGTCHIGDCDDWRQARCNEHKKCVCDDGFCEKLGACLPQTSAAPPAAVSAVREALGLKLLPSGALCQDTPGWTNGAALCAWDEKHGRDRAMCRPLPGAFWPSTAGWTCKAYEKRGWCVAGVKPEASSKFGLSGNFPEHNCCACGGGKEIKEGGAKISNATQQTCQSNTGGSCRFGFCADFRGPAECVDGHCVCQDTFCTDATGRCRKQVGMVTAEVAPVSAQYPVFPGTHAGVRTALCFSGGGSRSMAASSGYLRALHQLGLLDKIDLVSSVSGGTWPSSIFMFADMPLDKLLGSAVDVSDLTPAALDEAPAPLAGPATNHSNGVIARHFSEGTPLPMLWISSVAETILESFGLDDLDAYMAPDDETVRRILDRNPGLKGRKFLVPQPNRPRAFVMSGTVLAPDGYEASKDNVAPLQMSPDFTGVPFYLNDSTTSYTASPGNRRPPLRDILLGGGFVETFAFGGQEPSERQSGGDAVRLQAPLFPWSLARAVGISSAAFGARASRMGLGGFNAGVRCDPQVPMWPVTSASHMNAQSAITYQLGDGSNLDNTGLIAALQRGASKIVAVINNDAPLKGDADLWCSSAAADPSFEVAGKVTQQLAEKFGHDMSGDSFGFHEHNQVFERRELVPLLCDAARKLASGGAFVVRRHLKVLPNRWWGLPGGNNVDVVFVLLDRFSAFEDRLPKSTRELLSDEDSELTNFPNFRTVFQNTDLTSLTRRQVNLLAAQAEFTFKHHADTLMDLLR